MLGKQIVKALVNGGEASLVAFANPALLVQFAASRSNIVSELGFTAAAMGLVLFQTGNARGGFKELLLVTVEHFREFVVLFTGLFQAGFALTNAEDIFFDRDFQLANAALLVGLLRPQGAAAQ